MSTLTMGTSSKMKIKPISRRKKKEQNIYTSAIITRSINISIINVGKNLKETIHNIIVNQIEGKCISEGYIKPNSTVIISYSNGIVEGYNINFQVGIECLVCNPVEGTYLTCIAKNITKAGIRAQLSEENNPIVIFVARDHNYMVKNFSAVEAEQEIKVRIIGKRFELNDTYISVIAELSETKTITSKSKVKRIITKDDALPIALNSLSELPNSLPVASVSPASVVSPPVSEGLIANLASSLLPNK